ncbi:MAG: methionyl-tRNA formyltransferase [Chloroflexi bacterium]|nr:methionyl-tRNA formyltransferase [Chloroflexota bacterium]MCY3938249.1 methionyl-tRNA formyltransferase [Chloroflexota bacterium]
MRLVFLGTPQFAIPSLSRLHESHEIGLVITRPSRPVGRKQTRTPPAVFEEAERLGLDCIQPTNVNSAEVIGRIRSIAPTALVAVAFGRIIGPGLLGIASHGVLNVHPSLLPRHRGAAPVQGAILAGDSETGVTIMQMDEGLDTGPILAQRATPIGPNEMAYDLEARLAAVGAELLVETLEQLERGLVELRPQDESLATMTRPLKRADGVIDWRRPAEEIYGQWRALHPWPGTSTNAGQKRLKVLSCAVAECVEGSCPPGRAHFDGRRLIVGTGHSCLEINRIQPEGGRPMGGREFAIGHRAALEVDWGV